MMYDVLQAMLPEIKKLLRDARTSARVSPKADVLVAISNDSVLAKTGDLPVSERYACGMITRAGLVVMVRKFSEEAADHIENGSSCGHYFLFLSDEMNQMFFCLEEALETGAWPPALRQMGEN